MPDLISLKLRALAFIKRIVIRQAGCISDQRFYLDSYMATARDDVCRISVYSKPMEYSVSLPASAEQLVHSMRARYTYLIENPLVDSVSSCIYDRNGLIIAESTSWPLLRHLYDWPLPKASPIHYRLPGSFVFMPTSGYYHWLIEDLPAFLASLTARPEVVILCRANPPPYVHECLQLLPNNVVYIKGIQRVEQIVMTGKICGSGSPCGGLAPHPTDIWLLRSFFCQYLTKDSPNCKIYLTRVHNKRSPQNEIVLENIFRELGFIVFDGASMKLVDQIRLFSRASCVVGFHGAAFSNIIWCAPKTKVYEIFNSTYIPYCYAAISNIIGLDYRSRVIPSSSPGDSAPISCIDHILNDLTLTA